MDLRQLGKLTAGVLIILIPGLWVGVAYNSMPISIPVIAACTLLASQVVDSKKLFNKLDKKDKEKSESDLDFD
jgi:hypothetical protein